MKSSAMRAARRGSGVLLLLAACLAPAAEAPARSLRILHVMSFDSPWRWTDGQLAGFKAGLGEAAVEYEVFQLDVKRNGSPEARARKGKEARARVESWGPDLVYLSDDDAVEQVARPYRDQPLPIVFSGANKSAQTHGLEGAANVSGVLEQEHFVESVRLLQAIVPGARRLAVISDRGPQWPAVIDRIRERVASLPQTRLVAVDQVDSFADFKARVAGYAASADAVLYLGIFALGDGAGGNVPYQEVQRWVVENSRLPDISFWIDRVYFGTLASVTISEREQGMAAGRLARSILIDRTPPAALPIRPTVKGLPAINLARARQLGLRIDSTLLLSAEVVTGFEWERKKP